MRDARSTQGGGASGAGRAGILAASAVGATLGVLLPTTLKGKRIAERRSRRGGQA